MNAARALLCGAAVLFAPTIAAQHVRTLESARLQYDSTPVAVRLALGTGTLSVGAADAPYLYRSIARFGDAFEAPTSVWNATQHTLTLTAGRRSATAPTRSGTSDEVRTDQDWRVQLTRRSPLELSINATAADATVDLTGLPLRRFALRTGAGETTVRIDASNPESMSVFDATIGAGGMKLIGLGNTGASEARIESDFGDLALDLGGRWLRDMQLAVSTSVGDVTLTAPSNIGIELHTTGLLSRAAVSGSFTKSGGVWRSANYDAAAVRVRIAVKSVLGRVELTQR